MVYRRRPAKRRVYRSRARTRGKTGFLSTAAKALRIATRVASMVNVEYKYIETDVTGSVCNYNGNIFDALCLPPQGNSVNQREGDSIKMKNLTIEGTLYRNTIDEIVRIIIFLDKDDTITNPASFWEGIGAPNVVLADKNQDNKFKTKVLMDKMFTITSMFNLKKFKWVVPINTHLHFEKGSATDVTNNQLKMIVFSQAATNGSFLSYHSHVSYVDN